MTLDEFVAEVPKFSELGHSDKIRILGWYLHQFGGRERFDASTIRSCYESLHLPQPSNLNPYLKQLTESRSPSLLRDKAGYRLEARVRAGFDSRFGGARKTVAVSKLLSDLPGKVLVAAEQVFIDEAIVCYRYGAFRAAIVMTWNVAYDHLLNWLLADSGRLATFNARIPVRYPKRSNVTITTKSDFEEFKESELIAVAGSANLYSKNITKILEEKLTRRNMAAHPSTIKVTSAQAEDVITDLVNNVILALQ